MVSEPASPAAKEAQAAQATERAREEAAAAEAATKEAAETARKEKEDEAAAAAEEVAEAAARAAEAPVAASSSAAVSPPEYSDSDAGKRSESDEASKVGRRKKPSAQEIAEVAAANAAAAKKLEDDNNAAMRDAVDSAMQDWHNDQKRAKNSAADGAEIAEANDAAAKELADASEAAVREALDNATAQNDEIATANDAAAKELADANIAAPNEATQTPPQKVALTSLDDGAEDESEVYEEQEDEADPDEARKAWREQWTDLTVSGNSERLGNLVNLWFVAGTLDAEKDTSRSPFTLGHSLSELQRRSALREDTWDCFNPEGAHCAGETMRGICHEEPDAPQQMCFSRFLLGRRPVNGTVFSDISEVDNPDQLWWMYKEDQLARLADQAGAELRFQMHAYATHYNRDLWPQTAKKFGMAADHLVVHYRVGDVAVGSVLSPDSVIKAIELLDPVPSTVEILSGGIKHDAECAEAMEAYLEKLREQRRDAEKHDLQVTSALGSRLEAAKTDVALRKELVDDCRSKSIELLDRLRAGVQKGLPSANVIFDTAGMSTVDEDFFKAASAPMLVVSGGSFGVAAALASHSQVIRSPACGPEGCQWLQLTSDTEEQAREIRPGWHTYPYVMEGGQ